MTQVFRIIRIFGALFKKKGIQLFIETSAKRKGNNVQIYQHDVILSRSIENQKILHRKGACRKTEQTGCPDVVFDQEIKPLVLAEKNPYK